MTLAIGSLFSGIGGLELGLEWSGIGETVWQVERDAFCRAVLAHHWPHAERFTDVCTVGKANLLPVDLICGGFPCQDVSSAGKGAGLAGERSGLWREFARILGELRPTWVVVENVTSGARRWFDEVVRELEQLRYAVLPLPIAASDVGAPHRRARLFLVARADHQSSGMEPAPRRDVSGSTSDAHGNPVREQPRRSESQRTDSACAADAARVPSGSAARSARDEAPAHAANDDCARREGSGPGSHEGRSRFIPVAGWAPVADLVPLVHGLSGGLAGRRRRARIRALGNSVVPQCAEVVGHVIRELIEAEGAR
jgi:DNA (cytosine-5)-methyltransferase 1